jgi:hypothetical protein
MACCRGSDHIAVWETNVESPVDGNVTFYFSSELYRKISRKDRKSNLQAQREQNSMLQVASTSSTPTPLHDRPVRPIRL